MRKASRPLKLHPDLFIFCNPPISILNLVNGKMGRNVYIFYVAGYLVCLFLVYSLYAEPEEGNSDVLLIPSSLFSLDSKCQDYARYYQCLTARVYFWQPLLFWSCVYWVQSPNLCLPGGEVASWHIFSTH